MRALFALLVLFITVFAWGASQKKTKPLVLNYQQMINLTTSSRANYISDLRRLFVEIEKFQNKATHSKSIFNFEISPSSAEAQSPDLGCIYCGYQSQRNPSGTCTAPIAATVGCPQGQFHPNPAVFLDKGNQCIPLAEYSNSFCASREVSKTENSREYIKVNVAPAQVSAKAAIEEAVAQDPKLSDPKTGPGQALQQLQKDQGGEAPRASTPVSHDKESVPCKTNHDQSLVPGCAAFCTLCTLDKLAQEQGIRTSANWVAFLATISEVCKNKSGVPKNLGGVDLYQLLKQKEGDPHEVINMATKFGYCDEDDYLYYSPSEPARGDVPGQHRAPYGLAHSENFVGNVNPGDPRYDEYYIQFGITLDDAEDLFCPGTNGLSVTEDQYRDRLKKMIGSGKKSPHERFLKCAEKSLETKANIEKTRGLCTAQVHGLDSNEATVKSQLSQELSKGVPLALTYKEYHSSGNKDETAHCSAATALNGDEISILDSNAPYESDLNDPIKIHGDSKGRSLYGYSAVTCAGDPKSAPKSGAQSPRETVH